MPAVMEEINPSPAHTHTCTSHAVPTCAIITRDHGRPPERRMCQGRRRPGRPRPAKRVGAVLFRRPFWMPPQPPGAPAEEPELVVLADRSTHNPPADLSRESLSPGKRRDSESARPESPSKLIRRQQASAAAAPPPAAEALPQTRVLRAMPNFARVLSRHQPPKRDKPCPAPSVHGNRGH